MKRTYIYRLLTLKREKMDMELGIKLFYFLFFSLRIFSFIIIASSWSSRWEDYENSLNAVKAIIKLFRAKL